MALKRVSFAETWADREARHEAVLDVVSSFASLSPEQRPAAHAWRYSGEVNNGGHAQYFINLAAIEGLGFVPEVIAGMRAIGLGDAADILSAAYARWAGAARLAPADLADACAIFAEREFDDLDRAFYEIDKSGPESLSTRLDAYLAANERLFIVVDPPVAADLQLLALGGSAADVRGEASVWLPLLRHGCASVRLAAARRLIDSTPERSIEVLRAIWNDAGAGNHWRRSKAYDVLVEAGIDPQAR